MSENSSIEWTDHTFNPWRGCTMVSPGCAHCYAARESKRFPNIRGIWGDKGTRIVAVPSAWKEPLKWNRKAASCGQHEGATDCPICSGAQGPHRPRVFCASLADVFEDWQGDLRFPADIAPEGWVTARWDGVQLVREFEDSAAAQGLPPATMDNARTELFRLIEETPNLDWQLVTKRPENVMRMVPEHWRKAFPSNVWMGTTCEDQDRADERIPQLLEIPARVRFLSCEPLLGPVKIDHIRKGDDQWFPMQHLHWVIAGGESGPGARPMHPEWARSLRDQCQTAGVPFLFKQWGEYLPGEQTPESGTGYRRCDNGQPYFTTGKPHRENFGTHPDRFSGPLIALKLGKKAAGRHLDGRTWDEFPSDLSAVSAVVPTAPAADHGRMEA